MVLLSTTSLFVTLSLCVLLGSGACPSGFTNTCSKIVSEFAGVFYYDPPNTPESASDGLTGKNWIAFLPNGQRFEHTFLNYTTQPGQLQLAQVSKWSIDCNAYTSQVLSAGLAWASPADPLVVSDATRPSASAAVRCVADHLEIANAPDLPAGLVPLLRIYIDHIVFDLNFGGGALVPHC